MANAWVNFIAAGGNRHPCAADWLATEDGDLAFGAGCNIVLWKPMDKICGGVHSVLKGHEGSVNAVKFAQVTHANENVLISAGTDKTVRLWQQFPSLRAGYKSVATLTDHKAAVNVISAASGVSFFATGSADASVKIWRFAESAVGLGADVVQNISLSPIYFPLAIDMIHIPSCKTILLAVAGTSQKIQVFASSSDNADFKLVATLTGHEGWIRSLAFTFAHQGANADILLASGSQDKYVRLWRFHQGEQLPAISQAAKDPLLGSISKTLSNKPHRFTCGRNSEEKKYSITFEALLVGHEDWIYTARWNSRENQLRLLTSSADNSLAIWELDPNSEVWMCSVRLGEISSQKGATTATGSSGGFWIGLWSPTGDAVVSLGRTGAWRLWNYGKQDDTWKQHVAVTGHIREVRSLAWSKDGSYLLSTSADQTTRMFAEWRRGDAISWHEMSRSQVHGYDLNCIDTLGRTRFVSGADEKLLRVFEEPKSVARLLVDLSGTNTVEPDVLPDTAEIPVMGLSNKAADDAGDTNVVDGEAEDTTTSRFKTVIASEERPPVEDQLGRHLLWPELEKLYGHGYEISTVAVSHDGNLVATACRATSIDHAVIRCYETITWQEIKPPLKAHTLTVTRLQFSDDDQFLLSVGRDRQCCVWKRVETNPNQFQLLTSDSKAHSRMILDASWLPTVEQRALATVGRDKRLRVWLLLENCLQQKCEVTFDSPVTAVAGLQESTSGIVHLACGVETGSITLIQLSPESLECRGQPIALSHQIVPSKAVTSLRWRPMAAIDGKPQLAVASEDATVRVISVDVDNLR